MPTEQYTHGDTWSAPSGFDGTVTFRLYGQKPGSYSGGNGGYVEATVPATASDTFHFLGADSGGVTGTDGDGQNGGDYISVALNGNTLSDEILVAAGAGGDGDDLGADGGDGGADQGQDGSGYNPGTGGTQSSGGTGREYSGEDGSRGQGGDAYSGGGGGGGYYGGGGGGANNTGSAGGGGGGSNYTDTSVATVVANERGSSSKTSPVVEVEYVAPPASPANVSQTVVGDDSIDVSWDADTSGGPIDGYDVQVSEDGGSWTQVTQTTSTSYNYAATPSTNDHRFRVRAYNSDGTSGWSYSTTKTTDPTDLSVVGHGATSVNLSWMPTDDESNYRVLRAEASGSSVSDYTEVATPTSSSYTDTGLEQGERYYYRVQSEYSGTNSQLTNEVVQTTDLSSPTLDSLDTSVEDEITVGWTLNDNSSDGSVEIYRSTDGSLGTLIYTETDLSTTTYRDTGLDDGENYHYTVRRVTDHAQTDSGQQSAVTDLPAPSGVDTELI